MKAFARMGTVAVLITGVMVAVAVAANPIAPVIGGTYRGASVHHYKIKLVVGKARRTRAESSPHPGQGPDRPQLLEQLRRTTGRLECDASLSADGVRPGQIQRTRQPAWFEGFTSLCEKPPTIPSTGGADETLGSQGRDGGWGTALAVESPVGSGGAGQWH